MTSVNAHLVIIDPQNDFCDLPEAYCPAGSAPALPVAGAHADMLRVGQLIDAVGSALADISVTLDSHQRLDIAHPTFWERADGAAVTPFTQITARDVEACVYRPRLPDSYERVLAYLRALEAEGRYAHMVWPIHCEEGSWGHNVHADVRAAYNRWEDRTMRSVNKVFKGRNAWTEHYSAIRAEVPDPTDPHTDANEPFLKKLQQADRIFITGEAASHCVKATAEHIADYFGRDAAKLVIVTDCMSPVPGFEAQFESFKLDMQARGARLTTSGEVIAELATHP